MNIPTDGDGTMPVFIPGQHILGDVDFPPLEPAEPFTEQTNVTVQNDTMSSPGADNVKTEPPEMDATTTTEKPTTSTKMAIMMITPPPDVIGYRIVNEDGTDEQDLG